MANVSSRQIIDAWAQPVFKDGLLPEAVRVFEQSGTAHLLGQELSAAQLIELMDKAGVDRVMLDVMKLGGVTGWLRAAALAESWGLPASSHTFPEHPQGRGQAPPLPYTGLAGRSV